MDAASRHTSHYLWDNGWAFVQAAYLVLCRAAGHLAAAVTFVPSYFTGEFFLPTLKINYVQRERVFSKALKSIFVIDHNNNYQGQQAASRQQ